MQLFYKLKSRILKCIIKDEIQDIESSPTLHLGSIVCSEGGTDQDIIARDRVGHNCLPYPKTNLEVTCNLSEDQA